MSFRIPIPVLPPAPEPKMHKVHCRLCPSQPGAPVDPECEQIATWPHQQRVDTAFPCGWNPKRYCKGYCDSMGISNTDLEESDELHTQRTVR